MSTIDSHLDAKHAHTRAQGVGEFDEVGEGLLHLAHVGGDLPCHARNLFDGAGDQLRPLGLVLCRAVDALHEVGHLFRDDADGLQRDARLRDQFGLQDDLLHVLLDAL